MKYRNERLKKLNEYLIPEALEELRQHKGQRQYYSKVIELCKERDALKKGNLKGLIARLRNLDRFAIAYPIILSTALLSGCSTYERKELWRDIKEGYIHQISYNDKIQHSE